MDVRFSTKNFYIVSEKFVVLFPYDFSNYHPSPSKFWGAIAMKGWDSCTQ